MAKRRKRGDEPEEHTPTSRTADWNAVFTGATDNWDGALADPVGAAPAHDWNSVLRGELTAVRKPADADDGHESRPAAATSGQPAARGASRDESAGATSPQSPASPSPAGTRRFNPSAPGSRSASGRRNPFTDQLENPPWASQPAQPQPAMPEMRAAGAPPVAPANAAPQSPPPQTPQQVAGAAPGAQAIPGAQPDFGAQSPEQGLGPSWSDWSDSEQPVSLDDVLEMPDWSTDEPPENQSEKKQDLIDALETDPVEASWQEAVPAQLDVPQPVAVPSPAADVDIELDPDLVPRGIFDDPAPDPTGAAAVFDEDVDLPQGAPAPAAVPDQPIQASPAADADEPSAAIAGPETIATSRTVGAVEVDESAAPARSRPAAGNAEELRYERLQLVVVDDEVELLLLATELIEVIGMPPVRCEVNLCPPGTQLDSLKVHFNPKPWTPEDADIVWNLVSQWLPRVWATLCNRERAQGSVVETWVSYKDPALPGEQHLRIATTLNESTDFATFGQAHRNAIEERTGGKWFDPVVVPDH